MSYPVSEIFHSVQGEGFWTGTPMMFVRLAGCNVGRYESAGQVIAGDVYDNGVAPYPGNLRDFPLYRDKQHSICTTFDGQRFLCDTDYHPLLGQLTCEEIAKELHLEDHVCITGGEPFLHNLAPLIRTIFDNALEQCGVGTFHIETSGTLPINLKGDPPKTTIWITCCPKDAGKKLHNDIFDIADEWKVLVGPNFNIDQFIALDEKIPFSVEHRYLQPINGVNEVWQENLDHCLKLLEDWPQWKLSAQLHKFIGVR